MLQSACNVHKCAKMCKNEPGQWKVQYYKMYYITFAFKISINMHKCAKLRALSKNEPKDETNVHKAATNVHKAQQMYKKCA